MNALFAAMIVLVPPPTYLESVQLAQDFVVGSSQTVGTVVMSQNVGAATVVQLQTTDGSVATPATVTVQSGQKTANFNVTVDNPGGTVVAQVIAHAQGYSQRAKMAAVSTQGDLAITTLEARTGKGGVWLGWTGFPEDVYGKTLPGYKILRKQGAGQFVQVGKVTDTAQFVDTTASENVAYTYKVELRNSTGTLLAVSPERNVTKTGGGPTINWPPTGGTTWSGTKTVLLANPDPSQEHYDVYINDRLYGTASATEANGGSSQTIRLDLDTTQLANSVDMSGGEPNLLFVGGGTYKIVLSSTDEQTALHSSPPLYFNVSNGLSSVSNDGVCQTGGNEYGAIQGTFREAGTTTIQLQSEAGQTLRTWTFDDRRFAIVWDGKDGQGNAVGDGDYKWKVIGPPGDHYYRIVKVGASPEFLAIVNYYSLEPWRSESLAFDLRLKGYLDQMSQTTTRFSWLVYTVSEQERVDRAMVRKISQWLRNSCQYFYVQGHGVRRAERDTTHYFKIGGNVMVRNFGSASKSWSTITVPYWVGSRQYRFVFLDTCHSGGSNSSGVPADGPWIPLTYMTRYPHIRWADAFNINYSEIYEGAFMGFNGQMYFNSPAGKGQSWKEWRDHFWQALTNGLSFQEALTRADQRLPSFRPDPNPRSVWQEFNKPKRVTAGEYKW